MIYKKIFLSLLLISFFQSTFSQWAKIQFSQNRNIDLQYLEQHPEKQNEDLHIILHGEANKIIELINQQGGKVKYQTPSGVSALIKAKDIAVYSSSKFIDRIEFSLGQGKVLTNNSINRSRVNFVRQALPPLNQSYTGKGVIVGIIDTGIDFTHPDFQDTLGNTRILAIWDQRLGFDSTLTPSKYGYGQAWDSAAINNGTCTHIDPLSDFGHGTNVSGIAAGNGNSVNKSIADYTGYAPESHLVVVASNFNANNWTSTVADAVDYIFHLGDSLNMPVVINASLGQLTGSHDGLDAPAQFIDSLINAKPGRAMVCAAGNFGGLPDYHLSYNVNSDTSFTWFVSNPNSAFGFNAVFYELWADTNQFNNVNFSLGATDSSNGNLIGRTSFDQIQNRLNILYTDSIFDDSGSYVTQVQTYAERQGSRYLLQVFLNNPPRAHYYDLITTGSGKLDIWSSSLFGYSDMLKNNLPGIGTLPRLSFYQKPDTLQSIVSSWACSPNVLTVGNYTNRNSFVDVDSVTQNFAVTPGALSASSSRGPSRLGVLKPDLSAPGDYTLAAGLAADLNAIKAIPALRSFVGLGGYHRRVGGTSMASPAVAGVVAMMLEKCPNSDIQTLKNNLYNSAYTDTLTGTTLPNVEWGRGKLDGFAALNSSNFYPKINYSSDSLLCANETVNITTQNTYQSYAWSTGDSLSQVNISQQGFYSVSVTNPYGCSSSLDSIRVDSVPTPNFNLGLDTTICKENFVIFNLDTNLSNISWVDGSSSSTFQTNQVDSIVHVYAENQFGCGSSDTVLINYFQTPNPKLANDTSLCLGDSIKVSPGVFQTYVWSFGSNSDTISLKTQGTYSVSVTDSNNCSASDSIQILAVFPLPQFSLGNDTFLCFGHQLTLSGPSNMSSYFWTVGTSGNTLLVDSVGDYSLAVTDNNSCFFADTLAIFHIQNLPPKALNQTYEVCLKDSVSISGPNGNYTYLWDNGVFNKTQTFVSSSTINLAVTDSLGCSSIDTAEVIVNNLPVFNLGGDTGLCENVYSTIFLSGPTNMVNYNWVFGAGGPTASFCNGSPGAICDYSLPANGIVWLEVVDSNNCNFIDSIKIDTLPTPNINLGSDLLYCANNDTFSVDIDLQPFGYKFLFWSDNTFDFQKSLTEFGEFWVEVEDQNGCTNRDSVLIDSLPIPKFSLGNDTVLPPSIKSFVLGSGVQATNYLWFNQTSDSSVVLNFDNDYPKNIWLQVSNAEGCFYTDTVFVDWYAWGLEDQTSNFGAIIYPNPNNGNFVFKLQSSKVGLSQVQIFNSQGKLISNLKDKPFNNQLEINQSDLSPGIYFIKYMVRETIYTQPFTVY